MIIKIQRKLLTDEQKKYICEHVEQCSQCPLRSGSFRCFTDARVARDEIDRYWNGEIKVQL